MGKFIKVVSIVFIVFLYFFTVPSTVKAASLQSVSDTITTSRPSAAAPLDFDITTASGSAIIKDNGSMYLASDSAYLAASGAETAETINVASMSAGNTPISNDRVVFFTSTATQTHHKGDAVVVPITAMHTVQFTTQSTIPSGGFIVITFPGAGVNTASPSATTFSFNGLSSGNIKTNNATTCTWTISAPSITCQTNASIAGNVVVTFLIGCSSATGASCNTQVPTLINPTKTAAAGTSDTWSVNITTKDALSLPLDNSNTKINTIETVRVQANVDASLTFTITPLNSGVAANTGNTTGCTNVENTTAGTAQDPTLVDLGTLSSASIAIAAQYITITTNGAGGYTLTATSSGHLINPGNGFFITDSTTPTAITAGTSWFGIHACGLDVNTGTWGTGATGGGTGAKYGWPTQTTSVTLASDSTGPIGNTVATGNGITSVEYAGTVNATTPAGQYQSAITYVATATF